MKQMKKFLTVCLLFAVGLAPAQSVWVSDLGSGKYRNPVLFADYSDPDLIRTGNDYWMTASSFNCVPGLPILHSTDLVNWELVNYALPRMYDAAFDAPSHGNGVWAPAIRFHDGWYYIYWGDPDRGVYMVRTQDPRGSWSEPVLVKAAQGIIDTCPLWDEDGRAYMVHGWAGSRAGFKSVLSVSEMTPDGTALIGEEVLIFDGHDAHPTVEGPKFYKRNGYYYVFAPAGGVKPGWQIVLRSKSPWGPYECRTVLHQGGTSVPGPHQGAWIDDVEGNAWFMHFDDRYAYGRILHLQPMTWSEDDWCIIGVDRNDDGIGEPVEQWQKPASHGKSAVKAPVENDEFAGRTLGLQWQWHANPQTGWYFTDPTDGELRMNCVRNPEGWKNLWDTPNLLLQKVTAPDCTYTTKIDFREAYEGDRAGLVMMGQDYALVGVEYRDGRLSLVQIECLQANKGKSEQVNATVPFAGGSVWLRCRIAWKMDEKQIPQMHCQFAYSLNGKKFMEIGKPFIACEGQWIGAKIGYFATAEIKKNDGGRMDIDWFHVTK